MNKVQNILWFVHLSVSVSENRLGVHDNVLSPKRTTQREENASADNSYWRSSESVLGLRQARKHKGYHVEVPTLSTYRLSYYFQTVEDAVGEMNFNET